MWGLGLKVSRIVGAPRFASPQPYTPNPRRVCVGGVPHGDHVVLLIQLMACFVEVVLQSCFRLPQLSEADCQPLKASACLAVALRLSPRACAPSPGLPGLRTTPVLLVYILQNLCRGRSRRWHRIGIRRLWRGFPVGEGRAVAPLHCLEPSSLVSAAFVFIRAGGWQSVSGF